MTPDELLEYLVCQPRDARAWLALELHRERFEEDTTAHAQTLQAELARLRERCHERILARLREQITPHREQLQRLLLTDPSRQVRVTAAMAFPGAIEATGAEVARDVQRVRELLQTQDPIPSNFLQRRWLPITWHYLWRRGALERADLEWLSRKGDLRNWTDALRGIDRALPASIDVLLAGTAHRSARRAARGAEEEATATVTQEEARGREGSSLAREKALLRGLFVTLFRFLQHWPDDHGWRSMRDRPAEGAYTSLVACVDLLARHGHQLVGLYAESLELDPSRLQRLAERMLSNPRASGLERALAARLLLSWGVHRRASGAPVEVLLFELELVDAASSRDSNRRAPVPDTLGGQQLLLRHLCAPGELTSPTARLYALASFCNGFRGSQQHRQARTNFLSRIAQTDGLQTPRALLHALILAVERELDGILGPAPGPDPLSPPTASPEGAQQHSASSPMASTDQTRFFAAMRVARLLAAQLAPQRVYQRLLGGVSWLTGGGRPQSGEPQQRLLSLCQRARDAAVALLAGLCDSDRLLLIEQLLYLDHALCGFSQWTPLAVPLADQLLGHPRRASMLRSLIDPLQQASEAQQDELLKHLQRALQARFGREHAEEIWQHTLSSLTSERLRARMQQMRHKVTLYSLSGSYLTALAEQEHVDLRVLAHVAPLPHTPLRPVSGRPLRARVIDATGEVYPEQWEATTSADGVATFCLRLDALPDRARVQVSADETFEPDDLCIELHRTDVSMHFDRVEFPGDRAWRAMIAAALEPRRHPRIESPLDGGASGASVWQVNCDPPYAPLVLKIGPAPALRDEHRSYREVIAPTVPGLSYGLLPARDAGAAGALVYNLVDEPVSLDEAFNSGDRELFASNAISKLLDLLYNRWWRRVACTEYVSWQSLHPHNVLMGWSLHAEDIEWLHPHAQVTSRQQLEAWLTQDDAMRREPVTLRITEITTRSLKLAPGDESGVRLSVSLPDDGSGRRDWVDYLNRYPELRTPPDRIALRHRPDAPPVTRPRLSLFDTPDWPAGLGQRYEALVSERWRWPIAAIHGDLHPRNIILREQSQAQCYLIDFAHASLRGCPLFDLAKLELYLRLWSPIVPEADLEEIEQVVERASERSSRHEGSTRPPPRDASDAAGVDLDSWQPRQLGDLGVSNRLIEVLCKIRRIAGQILEQGEDARLYTRALAIVGLNTMKYFEKDHRSHPEGSLWCRHATLRALERL